MKLYVLFENHDWMPPLRQAFEKCGVAYEEWFIDQGGFDLQSKPPEGIFLNRMSPSSHTRGHQNGVFLARELLAWLESFGRRVINGSEAFALELSKVRQQSCLEAFGLKTPRTFFANNLADLEKFATQLPFPFITKDNQGGKGLGVQLFHDRTSFNQYIHSPTLQFGPDGLLLLQEYIPPQHQQITRVEIVNGKFVYAIHASVAGGFELCPADACQIGDLVCPVGESSPSASLFTKASDVPSSLIRLYEAFCVKHKIDLAGIEYIQRENGETLTYDIDGTTNYNSTIESQTDHAGARALARFCKDELERLY